jgi:DNA-binding transcriptional regulator YiaG
MIKIGWSSNVNDRLTDLQFASPVELTLAACIEVTGNQLIERQLHRKFDHLRAHGEWFRVDSELRAFVSNIDIAIRTVDISPFTKRRTRAPRTFVSIPESSIDLASAAIRSARKGAHMTQSQLAKKMGVSKAAVSAWETRVSMPSRRRIIELSGILKLDVAVILGESP